MGEDVKTLVTEPSPRRIIQIQEYRWQDWRRSQAGHLHVERNGMLALCNDGTLWNIHQEVGEDSPSEELRWEQFPPIPQNS